jgi:hypothetical protein
MRSEVTETVDELVVENSLIVELRVIHTTLMDGLSSGVTRFMVW